MLDERPDANHFARLGMRPEDPIDREAVEAVYLRLSRALHPDFHGSADEAGRARANRNTALLNEAWKILDDDVSRAEYRLGLLDSDALEKHKQLDPSFLMEAMEISEEAEGGDAELRTQIGERVRGEIASRMDRLSEDAAWSPPSSGMRWQRMGCYRDG